MVTANVEYLKPEQYEIRVGHLRKKIKLQAEQITRLERSCADLRLRNGELLNQEKKLREEIKILESDLDTLVM